MSARVDLDKIAEGLRAERRGKVEARGGYFGAMQLLADVEARLRVPSRGGRATDPNWTERRLLPLAPETLQRLEDLAEKMRTQWGISIEPMQLAALILERTAEQVSVDEAGDLVQTQKAQRTPRRRRRGG